MDLEWQQDPVTHRAYAVVSHETSQFEAEAAVWWDFHDGGETLRAEATFNGKTITRKRSVSPDAAIEVVEEVARDLATKVFKEIERRANKLQRRLL